MFVVLVSSKKVDLRFSRQILSLFLVLIVLSNVFGFDDSPHTRKPHGKEAEETFVGWANEILIPEPTTMR